MDFILYKLLKSISETFFGVVDIVWAKFYAILLIAFMDFVLTRYGDNWGSPMFELVSLTFGY